MELNNTHANNPAVGIHLFENIPPVGNRNCTIQLEKINHTLKISRIEDKSVKTEKRGEIPKKVFVKGFGDTALFAAGLIMASQQTDFSIRLDGPMSGDILNDAEQICARNPIIVKKFYNSEDALDKENGQESRIQPNGNLDIAIDDLNEIFASDYSKKGKGLSSNWRNL